jgi:serine/threonine protein kinase
LANDSRNIQKPESVRELFESALDKAGSERECFLRELQANNKDTARRIRELLSAHEAAGIDFLRNPLVAREPVPLSSGMEIGPYRIVRELGRGGMGVVYEAERSDGIFERKSALKVMLREANSEQIRHRFHIERGILARLDHPNVVRIVDGGDTAAGCPYFVMDYIDGQPIDLYCFNHEIELPARLALFQQVCAAVQYLHEQNILHCDIKPSNILVNSDGRPRLLDFGISQIKAASQNDTESRGVTVLYASPEQLRGLPGSEQGDVYSLGVVLYLLLTERLPHEARQGESTADLATRVVHDPPARPSDIAGGRPFRVLTGDLDEIVLRALRKFPEDRYFSPARLSEDIERYLLGQPVAARSAERGYRLRKFIRQQRYRLAVAGLFSMVIAYSINLAVDKVQLQRRHQALAQMPARLASELGLADSGFPAIPASELSLPQMQSILDFARDYKVKFDEAIRIEPNLTPERRQILQAAFQQLERAATFADQDPEKRYWVANAFFYFGNLQGYPNQHPNAGDVDGALRSYLKAEALLPANPSDLRSRELLRRILSHRNIVETALQSRTQ